MQPSPIRRRSTTHQRRNTTARRRTSTRPVRTYDVEYSIQVLRCFYQIKAITRELQTISHFIYHIHHNSAAKVHQHFDQSYNRFKRLCTALMIILANMEHTTSRDRITSFRAEIHEEWQLAANARRVMDAHASFSRQHNAPLSAEQSVVGSPASNVPSTPEYEESSTTPEPHSPISSTASSTTDSS